MKPLGLNEIREKYLAFFESKQHLRMKSFSLVPQNDKSLLIINSGMAPLKPYFTGQEIPPNRRVTTCQKCIRTGDIENVGVTSRHGTFFEMLGNFSFGDYFKEEAIPWAWEFLTEVMEIPPEKLHISVFLDDDEAYGIWNEKVGIPHEKIHRLGKKDNFWEHGLGPCGPCSEIYFDRGAAFGSDDFMESADKDEDRYVEIWNLVFTQFSKEEDGSYSRLEKPNIDTGMGLERISAMMQGVSSIFDVDTIKAVRDEVCRIAGVKYGADPKRDMSVRIITDHIRSVTFMTADGILPSNEGRGYVLRRLLRRAARHGKLLGIDSLFLTDLSAVAMEVSKDAYPELEEKKDYIFKLIGVEENRFYETLDGGMEILRKSIASLKEGLLKELPGADAFRLYDTYGFPLELMQEILLEEGLGLAVDAFQAEMEKQRLMGRSARAESTFMGADATVFDRLDPAMKTEFLGYTQDEVQDGKILALIAGGEIVDKAGELDEVTVITDKTPAYTESGGQKGDGAIIQTPTGKVIVKDCIKAGAGKTAHIGNLVEGFIQVGQVGAIAIDKERRMDTARNHSATHLLQKALRDVLGSHVEQSGSYVSADRLRFDFTHFEAMSRKDLIRVEEAVNKAILDGMDVSTMEMTMVDARKTGAMALFGEKYGDLVRVVKMGDYSVELCGGTHLRNTAQAGSFKILSESSVAAGVRRIEAITGRHALAYYREQEEKLDAIASFVKSTRENIIKRIEFFINQAQDMGKELQKLKAKSTGNLIEEILAQKENIGKFPVVAAVLEHMDMNALRTMGDSLRDRVGSGIVVIFGKDGEKANLVVTATDDVVKMGINCGNIIKKAAAAAGGGGGGRPNMAQAGIKDSGLVDVAMKAAKDEIRG